MDKEFALNSDGLEDEVVSAMSLLFEICHLVNNWFLVLLSASTSHPKVKVVP